MFSLPKSRGTSNQTLKCRKSFFIIEIFPVHSQAAISEYTLSLGLFILEANALEALTLK